MYVGAWYFKFVVFVDCVVSTRVFSFVVCRRRCVCQLLHGDCLDLCRICLVDESCMTFVWHPCQIVVSIRVASVSNCLLCWAQVAANDSNIDINMVELLQVASDKLLVQFNVAMVGNSYRPGVIRRNHRYRHTLHAVCKHVELK